VAVARSSSDGVAIRYVLPVLWMTSNFHTVVPMSGRVRCRVVSCVAVAVVAGRRCCCPMQWLASSAGRLAGAALVVRRLDSAAAGDGGARFAVCFMLVLSCAPEAKPAIYDCLVFSVMVPRDGHQLFGAHSRFVLKS